MKILGVTNLMLKIAVLSNGNNFMARFCTREAIHGVPLLCGNGNIAEGLYGLPTRDERHMMTVLQQ